jgi:peptidyl-prolyl cis-trans isomerase SurA
MNDGDFGCVTKGMFVPEFDKMAQSMEPGQISPPFKTMYGWHILKLNERRGDTYCGAHILVTPRIDPEQLAKARNQLDSVRKLIIDGKMSFEEAAKMFSAEENTKNNGGKVYNHQNGTFKFDVSELDREVALTTNQLTPGEISPVVSFTNEIGQQAFRLIKLNMVFAPHVANLLDDYPLFQRAAQEDKKQKNQNEWYKEKAASTHLWITDEYKTCSFTFREPISAN